MHVFAAVSEDAGVDWIDLAADGCTLRYTSEGPDVLQFDVCGGAQLQDFAGFFPNLPPKCFGLRMAANGDTFVACQSEVVRLNSAGSVVQTYSAASLGDTDVRI